MVNKGMKYVYLILCLVSSPWNFAQQVSSAEDIRNIVIKTNDYWQAHNSVKGNPFWENGAYHTANIEAYLLTNKSEYLQYSTAWAEYNEWQGAKSDDKTSWVYNYGTSPNHVLFGDYQVCFQTYIDLFTFAPKPHKIARVREVMEYQMNTSKNDYWWWADGLYMVMPVMTKMYKLTGNEQYLDKLHEYYMFAENLMYDKESALFFRDAKYIYPKHKSVNGKKDFWARGNGWVLAGFAKILDDMPKTSQYYPIFLDRYTTMAKSVAACQQAEGYWTRSMLDNKHAPGPETSGTAFFTYGLLWGINNGILELDDYKGVIEKSWHYLSTVALQPDGRVGFVQPVGEKAIPGQIVNENSTSAFGVGAFLLAACEYTRYVEKAEKLNKTVSVFKVKSPDFALSPNTGMTREHWKDAAMYLLEGAFSYVKTLDDPMRFAKQPGKSYPHSEAQEPTAKLEALCRTSFLAGPLLKENPTLKINNIPLADYYRTQILLLLDSSSETYVPLRKPGSRGHGGQRLVELGGLAVSMMLAPEVFWEPFSQKQKDALAEMMLGYGQGGTIDMNWRFFNINIMSFFKSKGYQINESYLEELLQKVLSDYRGNGWYNDSPYYDYYSMWAFQMYGSLWAEFFGKKYYPNYASQFLANLRDLTDHYPYMFAQNGHMIMWGRSIGYRMGAAVPLGLLGILNDETINYGWMRGITSSTILQFLQHPDFLEEGLPTLGYYKAFEPAIQGYSCRASMFWLSKLFQILYIPADNPFWRAKENNGEWNNFKPSNVYNHYAEKANILLTNYPAIGAAEIRSTASSKKVGRYEGTENYNRLSYNSAFPWQADGKNGEVAMNYVVKNKDNKWEALRIYRFQKYEDGFYCREAELASNPNIRFQLAEMLLPNGILRVDKVVSDSLIDIRLGHYGLAQRENLISSSVLSSDQSKVLINDNGQYKLAMAGLNGWSNIETVRSLGLHPESQYSSVINLSDTSTGKRVYITLQLWKKSNETFAPEDFDIIQRIRYSDNGNTLNIIFRDGSQRKVSFK